MERGQIGNQELYKYTPSDFWWNCSDIIGSGIMIPSTITKSVPKVSYLAIPEITKVIFNNPTTVVIWDDGTKTIVRCGKDEVFYEDAGLSAAISKKLFGSRAAFLREVAKAERQLPKEQYKKKKVNK